MEQVRTQILFINIRPHSFIPGPYDVVCHDSDLPLGNNLFTLLLLILLDVCRVVCPYFSQISQPVFSITQGSQTIVSFPQTNATSVAWFVTVVAS